MIPYSSTNEHGVHSVIERISGSGDGWSCEIKLARLDENTWYFGLDIETSSEGMGFAPNRKHQPYSTREDAIAAAVDYGVRSLSHFSRETPARRESIEKATQFFINHKQMDLFPGS
jgi:glucan phosphorylase